MRIKRLKRGLEGWREAVLLGHGVLLWERGWHAGALLAGSTLAFICLWLCEPSLLTAMSVLGLACCVADYCGPAASGALLRGPWTAAQERRLDELCRSLVLQYTHTATALASFCLLRTVRPRVFYAVLGVALLTLAWLGSVVHNLLLTYVLVTGTLLMPGLRARGMFAPYAHRLSDTFMQLLVQHHKKD